MENKINSERKAPTGTITGVEALRTDWMTPPYLVELVSRYFGGEIPYDAATSADNPCNAKTFSTEDGISRSWPNQIWCNAPYGRVLKHWLWKMSKEAGYGKEIISLIPCARFEQGYFQDSLSNASVYCFIRKRVNFINPRTGDAVGGNPYANMFLGWNVDEKLFANIFSEVGNVFSVSLIRRRQDVSEKKRAPAPRKSVIRRRKK